MSPRHFMVEALKADLIGPFDPASGKETLETAPSRWYLTGFLVPEQARESSEKQREEEEAEEEEAVRLQRGEKVAREFSDTQPSIPEKASPKAEDDSDESPFKRKLRLPSSMGLSVIVPKGASLHVTVTYGRYEHLLEELPSTERTEKGKKKRSRHASRYVRIPDPVTRSTTLTAADRKNQSLRQLGTTASSKKEGTRADGSLEPGVYLEWQSAELARDRAEEPQELVTIFLVNRNEVKEKDGGRLDPHDREENTLFQVSMALRCEDGFLPRPSRSGSADLDDRIYDLQYRNVAEYAIGHNIAAHWHPPAKSKKVVAVSTDWLPTFEVARVDPLVGKNARGESVELSMRKLSEITAASVDKMLSPLLEGYAAWILHQEKEILVPSHSDYEFTRKSLSNEAKLALRRMQDGALLLKQDPDVLESFRLANLAMYTMRKESNRIEGRTEDPTWRTFQLAFFLYSIAGLNDEAHADRKRVDVIFFPTGGGKTEAYLSIIAFLLCLRRIRGKSVPHRGLGVAVILRYTLRLLTLDQLRRAAQLICALELIRLWRVEKKDLSLGSDRFSIGMWVGSGSAPNTFEDAADRIKEARGDVVKGGQKRGTPKFEDSHFPLPECPWCKTAFTVGGFQEEDAAVLLFCDDLACAFGRNGIAREGVPVLYIDEHIYYELPCFLLATVDKFARVPHEPKAGKLFGLTERRENGLFLGPDERSPRGKKKAAKGEKKGGSFGKDSFEVALLPPELIVQDELHLITGPLGSMVGLYERGFLYLMEKVGGKKPKIVASTATLKRSTNQVAALYERKAAIFPPRGLDPNANYFSAPVTPTDKDPGRLYLGISATGKPLKRVLFHVYATLLGAAKTAYDHALADPNERAVADAYMTLVGYFNSLRELGGMQYLVEDDVTNRLKGGRSSKWVRVPLDHQGGKHHWLSARQLNNLDELTSRKSTSEVGKAKQLVAAPFVEAGSAGKKGAAPSATGIDVLLASNMISVGVDIERLGLMVISGQPKTTSEYIQASSRVGRSKNRPGLVVTCYNTSRPRDRSHYEHFLNYHESFYRFVEAQSVTPFSTGALDRGLAGLVVTMARYSDPSMTPDTGAANLVGLAKARKSIRDALHASDSPEKVASLVDAKFDEWEKLAGEKLGLHYKEKPSLVMKREQEVSRNARNLSGRVEEKEGSEQFSLQTSMRDVEPVIAFRVQPAPFIGLFSDMTQSDPIESKGKT